MNLVFVLDPINFEYIKINRQFTLPLSHDKYTISLSLAISEHYSCDIYYHSIDHGNEILKIGNLLENFTILESPIKDILDAKSTLFTICPTQLINFRNYNCRKIALIAALHWLESPFLHDESYHHDYLIAVRDIADGIVTQNERMKCLMNWYSQSIACINLEDRIIICPSPMNNMSVFTNQKTSAKSKDLCTNIQEKWINTEKRLLVCSGGIWNWTNYVPFLKAFVKLCKFNSPHPLRLLITGFAPPNLQNYHEHERTIKDVKEILAYSSEIVSDVIELNENHCIGVIEDWSEANVVLKSVMDKAFLGLSLNKETTESWQSFRQRTTDYILSDLPFLHTGAGAHAGLEIKNGVLSTSECSSDIYKKLVWICENIKTVSEMRPVSLFNDNIDLSLNGIKQIFELPKRNFQSTRLGKSILEIHRDTTILPVIKNSFH